MNAGFCRPAPIFGLVILCQIPDGQNAKNWRGICGKMARRLAVSAVLKINRVASAVRDKASQMSSGNLARRLERIEAEFAPPEDPQMMEIQFIALVGGQIIHRMFIPAESPKRGRRRPWSQNADVRALSWNWGRTDELTAPPGAQAAR